jgi:hypothetical protein
MDNTILGSMKFGGNHISEGEERGNRKTVTTQKPVIVKAPQAPQKSSSGKS